jgi:hypothetical protein
MTKTPQRLREPSQEGPPSLLSWRTASTWVTVSPAVLTLVLGGAFLDRGSLGTDEASTWISSIQTIPHIVRNSTYVDGMFLPYYLFMHFWLKASWSLWWMRLPSLLAGAAAVAALALLARRWLPPGWSMLAGFLLALNPLFVEFTMEARPYTAATLFAVLSIATLVRAIDRGSTLRWVLYGLASLCMLLLQLIAVLVLVAQLVGIAVVRRRSAWLGMTATLACVVLVVSPLAVIAVGETRQISWIPPATLGTFREALIDASGGAAMAAVLVICGLILAATIASSPAGGELALGAALCLAWGAVPPLLLVFLSFLRPIFVDRYMVMSLPAVALIETMGAWRVWVILTAALSRNRELTDQETQTSSLLRFIRPRRGSSRWAPIVTVLACLGAFIGAFTFVAHTSHVLREGYVYDDYRSAAAALGNDLLRRPAPVVITPDWAGVGFAYYATPTLAHALLGQAVQTLNRRKIDWQSSTFGSRTGDVLLRSTVLGWPIGARRESPVVRCVAGWAIGRGRAPSKTFIIDSSSCDLSRVLYYGQVWIASIGG